MSPGLSARLDQPIHRVRAAWAAVGVLAWMALFLRWGIDSGGVLDIDAMNFGLAARRFDVLDHQPHPPGYPGYVLFLELVDLLGPAMGPVNIAKWGARVCGALTVPAAFWACRELLAGGGAAGEEDGGALGRPLVAALLAAIHPLLWYYGADGQSHAAEALVTVLLFALVMRARRRPTLGRLLLVVAVFGLAGSLRPTIPMLSSPLLLWLFRGRPLRDWALAAAVGVAAVLVWAAPLVAMTGGWDLYRRASRALITELYVAQYSALSPRSNPILVIANIVITLWFAAVALVPALALSPRRGPAVAPRRWLLPWLAVIAFNILFYALVFVAEAGYLAAVAGLSCLVPATWPARPAPAARARFALVFLAAPCVLLFGPAEVPVPHHPPAYMPTLQRAVDEQGEQEIYRAGLCGAAGGRRAVALTDIPVTTHTRQVPITCPNVALALYLHKVPTAPRVLDVWLIFFADGMMAVPTGVPLEPGPPAVVRLPEPVEVILIAPDASRAFQDLVRSQLVCAPEVYVAPGTGLEVLRAPVACLPALRSPTHTLDFTAALPPGAGRFGGL